MAKKETTHAGILGDWQRILEPLTTNAADLAHLEVSRAKLADLIARAAALDKEKAAHRALKQEMAKQFQALIVDGQRLAALLRAGVKEHYGIRSEKLAAFGLQPFRGRKAKVAPEQPEDPNTPPVIVAPSTTHQP